RPCPGASRPCPAAPPSRAGRPAAAAGCSRPAAWRAQPARRWKEIRATTPARLYQAPAPHARPWAAAPHGRLAPIDCVQHRAPGTAAREKTRMPHGPLVWELTIALIVGLLLFDYFFHIRVAHIPTIGEAARWSAAYVGVAILFGGAVWYWGGTEMGIQYFAGYLTEKAL